MSVWMIGIIALLAEGAGLTLGISMVYEWKVIHERVMGMLFGGTSGLMIALICFDILPEALKSNRVDLVIIGILLGVIIGLGIDSISIWIRQFIHNQSKILNTAIVLTVGIAIHNIPEGFALGALAIASKEAIIQFAVILALHSIPEGIALAIPFKASNVTYKKVTIIPWMLGSIMGIGAILGYTLSHLADIFIVIALGIASGVILYIVCEELMPESRQIWNGRMTSIATILGMILGLLLLKA